MSCEYSISTSTPGNNDSKFVVTSFTGPSIQSQTVPSTTTPPRDIKHVRFPEDEKDLAVVFDTRDKEAWRVDPDTPNHFIVDCYAEACLRLNRPPISSVIEQLSKATFPLTKNKIAGIILKGTQLKSEDIEALECILKYCQMYHLSFENTNLNDKSLFSLLEALDYYVPCSELCLARNKGISKEGIERLGTFISKNPQLNWLDLRGISLNIAEAKHLSRSFNAQREEGRKVVNKFLAHCTGDEPVNSDASRDAQLDPEAFRLTFPAFTGHSFASCTSAEINTISGALQRLPPMGLRGLHLGETGLHGAALFEVVSSIRVVGLLRDLRLPGNKLCAHDVELMVPLLRYYPGLQVLDLSNNNLEDAGYRILADALSRPAYPSDLGVSYSPGKSDSSCCNLRRLYLAKTGLTPVGAKHFATCFPKLRRLTHLELSDNTDLGCQGVIALRTPLQSYTRRCLVYLGLGRCGIACQGAIALAEVLGDTPRGLRRIDLTGNHVAEAGLLAISKSIPLCSGLVHLQGLEDNRPIQGASYNGISAQKSLFNNGTTDHANQNGKLPNGISAKFSIFKFAKNVNNNHSNTSGSNENLTRAKRRSVSRHATLLEPSQLSLDLLQKIHLQLAAKVDKRLAGHHNLNESIPLRPISNEDKSLRFFRGYVRFPLTTSGTRREPDPRHLCGDTSDSDSDDSDSDLDSCTSSSAAEKTSSGVLPSSLREEREPSTEKSFVDDDYILQSDCKKQ